jgi:hypothetical protein
MPTQLIMWEQQREVQWRQVRIPNLLLFSNWLVQISVSFSSHIIVQVKCQPPRYAWTINSQDLPIELRNDLCSKASWFPINSLARRNISTWFSAPWIVTAISLSKPSVTPRRIFTCASISLSKTYKGQVRLAPQNMYLWTFLLNPLRMVPWCRNM